MNLKSVLGYIESGLHLGGRAFCQKEEEAGFYLLKMAIKCFYQQLHKLELLLLLI